MNLLKKLKMSLKIFDGNPNTQKTDSPGLSVKPLGSAGSSDPLNQRSTVGWKAIKTAERLVEEYMIRVESVSPKYSKKITKAN